MRERGFCTSSTLSSGKEWTSIVSFIPVVAVFQWKGHWFSLARTAYTAKQLLINHVERRGFMPNLRIFVKIIYYLIFCNAHHILFFIISMFIPQIILKQCQKTMHHRLRTVITKCSYIFLHTSISCSVFNPSLEQWAESWALMFQCMGFVLLRLWLDTLCVLGGFENVCQHLCWSISQVLQTIIMSRNTYCPGWYHQVLQGLEMRLNSLNNQPFLHLLYHDNM